MRVLLCQKDTHDNPILQKVLEQQEAIDLTVCTTDEGCVQNGITEPPDICFVSLDRSAQQLANIRSWIFRLHKQPFLCLIGTKQEIGSHAFRSNCDRILISPYKEHEAQECIEEISRICQQPVEVTIRTFGSFDVMVNGRTVIFHNAKAKELLALCIDQTGRIVTAKKAIAKLWPDRFYDECTKRLYRKAVSAVTDTLHINGISHIFCHFRGGCIANVRDSDCDYLSFLANPAEQLQQPYQFYLPQYDWAEEGIGRLTRLAEAVKEKRYDARVF